MQLLPVGYRGRSNNQFVAPACSWSFFCPTTTETKELKSDAEKVEVTRVKAKVLLSSALMKGVCMGSYQLMSEMARLC